MIKLAEKGFHIATINILKDLKENINIINKGMKNFKSKWILELINLIFNIKKLPDGSKIRYYRKKR